MQRTDKDDTGKFDMVIRKRIRQEGLEQPSLNFTNSIISKIEAEKRPKQVLVYKPLINIRLWLGITAVLIGVFTFLLYGDAVIKYNWWPEKVLLELGKINVLDKMPEFSVSDIYVYAFIGLAFFVGLQIVLLKNHFDKRYFFK
jgi:hypothetical protein